MHKTKCVLRFGYATCDYHTQLTMPGVQKTKTTPKVTREAAMRALLQIESLSETLRTFINQEQTSPRDPFAVSPDESNAPCPHRERSLTAAWRAGSSSPEPCNVPRFARSPCHDYSLSAQQESPEVVD